MKNYLYRDYLALNVYVALCYYKLDYFDVSQVSDNLNSLYISAASQRILFNLVYASLFNMPRV